MCHGACESDSLIEDVGDLATSPSQECIASGKQRKRRWLYVCAALNEDTSLTMTLSSAPLVSRLERLQFTSLLPYKPHPSCQHS